MERLPNIDSFLPLALLLLLSGCATAAAPAKRPPAAQAAESTRPAQAAAPSVQTVEPAAPAPVKVDPCQQERSLDTADACADYLRACPSSSNRSDILALMSRLIEKQKGGYKDYKKFVLEFDDGLPFVPFRQRLSLTGPEGLRVHDIIEALKSGEEHGVVLENVRRKNAVYRDFTPEEIDALKQMGLTGDIIQSMIDSTFDAELAGSARQRQASGAYAPISQMGGIYTSGAQQETAPGQYVPSVNNVVANCTAQAAALEACRRMSGLARSICNSTAKLQFPCQ